MNPNNFTLDYAADGGAASKTLDVSRARKSSAAHSLSSVRASSPFDSPLIDARYWHYFFGLAILPILPISQKAARRREPWLSKLSLEAINRHWARHPDHELGFIIGPDLVAFDADSPAAIVALHALEEKHRLSPRLVIATGFGEYHLYKKPEGVFVRPPSDWRETFSGGIDIKTDGERLNLPWGSGRSLRVANVGRACDLSVASQALIDDIDAYNTSTPPLPDEADRD